MVPSQSTTLRLTTGSPRCRLRPPPLQGLQEPLRPGSLPGLCYPRSFPPKAPPPTGPAAQRTNLRAGQTLNLTSSQFKLQKGRLRPERSLPVPDQTRSSHRAPFSMQGLGIPAPPCLVTCAFLSSEDTSAPPPSRKCPFQLWAAARAATSPQYPRPQ